MRVESPETAKLSKQRGERDFAISRSAKAFTNGITKDVPTRTLMEKGLNAVDYDHGFCLRQGYDGLVEKVEDQFGCGLRPEENRANWKNKKDSISDFQRTMCGFLSSQGSVPFANDELIEWMEQE